MSFEQDGKNDTASSIFHSERLIMRVLAAFVFVMLLWSTTPLAIQWSGQGPGYLFGAGSRMTLGLTCLLVALPMLKRKMPWHRAARLTYLAVAAQLYGAMLAVYWAAQYIPSGWISVIFGLSPMMTALMAARWLRESSLGLIKLLAYASGFAGLLVMFGSALELSPQAAPGISAVLLGAFIQSASAVLIKRIDAGIPSTYQVTGGLMLAVPLYWVTWFWQDGHWPAQLPVVSLASIAYLGLIATTLGFVLYFYVLTHLPATRVALITLMTPLLSLLLGHRVNHEPLSEKVLLGTALILAALLMHQFDERWHRRRPIRPND